MTNTILAFAISNPDPQDHLGRYPSNPLYTREWFFQTLARELSYYAELTQIRFHTRRPNPSNAMSVNCSSIALYFRNYKDSYEDTVRNIIHRILKQFAPLPSPYVLMRMDIDDGLAFVVKDTKKLLDLSSKYLNQWHAMPVGDQKLRPYSSSSDYNILYVYDVAKDQFTEYEGCKINMSWYVYPKQPTGYYTMINGASMDGVYTGGYAFEETQPELKTEKHVPQDALDKALADMCMQDEPHAVMIMVKLGANPRANMCEALSRAALAGHEKVVKALLALRCYNDKACQKEVEGILVACSSHYPREALQAFVNYAKKSLG